MAVLAIDGPGQYESATLGIHVSVPNWQQAAKVIADWVIARPEIDPARVGVCGASFGSLFTTIAAAAEPRFRAIAVSGTCLEPGCHTIFEEASPTFKKRFMYMAGYTEEVPFDEFCKTLSWQGHAEKIQAPFLCLGGERDELSPLEHADRMFRAMTAPRRLVVYQEARHSVGGVPSANLGPTPGILVADWMAATLSGQSFASERWYVDATGQISKTAY
jgi:dipeptidyl aminopeptidase/acylaminoacyl peptidase